MNSFISHFKVWLLALLCISITEVSYFLIFKPPRIAWNSFLDLKFTEDESVQRLVAHHKIQAFSDSHSDIVQVGDSSGLHGVQSKIVMSFLPGIRYTNMSVATNLGYSGYLNIAKIMLKRNPTARYLVLYTSPVGGLPRKKLWDDDQMLMADRIYQEFLNPLRALVQFPSLASRQALIANSYYMGYSLKSKEHLLSHNRGYLAFNAIYRESYGWTRETDIEGDTPSNIYQAFRAKKPSGDGIGVTKEFNIKRIPKMTDESFFDWRTLSHKSYFDYVYGAFADLAKQHNVKLIVIFNPIPKGIQASVFKDLMDWGAIATAINRVKKLRPEVVITDFEFWPDEKFSVFSHIATPYSLESSERVGRMLKNILASDQIASLDADTPIAQKTSKEHIVIDFVRPYCGYGFVDGNKKTESFPLRYMRDKAFLFVSAMPGPNGLRMRADFRANMVGKSTSLDARVNGELLKRTSSQNSKQRFLEWEIPKRIATKYLGWLVIQFSRDRLATDLLEFQSVEIDQDAV